MQTTKIKKITTFITALFLFISTQGAAQNLRGAVVFVDYSRVYNECSQGRELNQKLLNFENHKNNQVNYLKYEIQQLSNQYHTQKHTVSKQQLDQISRLYHQKNNALKANIKEFDRQLSTMRSDGYKKIERVFNQVMNQMNQEMNLSGIYYELEKIPAGVQYYDMTDRVINAVSGYQ